MDDDSLSVDDVLKIIRDKVGTTEKTDGEDENKKPPFAKNGEGKDEEDEMFDDPAKKKKFEEMVNTTVSNLTEQVTSANTKLHAFEKREQVRSFMESNNLNAKTLGQSRVKLLESAADETAMKTLLESWPPSVRSMAPPAGELSNLTEQVAAKVPGTFEGVRSLLRSR